MSDIFNISNILILNVKFGAIADELIISFNNMNRWPTDGGNIRDICHHRRATLKHESK